MISGLTCIFFLVPGTFDFCSGQLGDFFYFSLKKMDYSLAVALSLLQLLNVGAAAPLPGDVVRMKAKVKWMADQLVVKLNKDFQVSVR